VPRRIRHRLRSFSDIINWLVIEVVRWVFKYFDVDLVFIQVL